mgnify:CR=1 FL=1
MDRPDVIDWEKFRAGTSTTLKKTEVVLVSQLHAKYFKHKYKVPCSCSPTRIQKWIRELNDLYENRNNT